MGKSASEYYAEKMKKLLESRDQSTPERLTPPPKAYLHTPPQENKSGAYQRSYYEDFRRKSSETQKIKNAAEKSGGTSNMSGRERVVADNARRRQQESERLKNARPNGTRPTNGTKGGSPEQTVEDMKRERNARAEAMQKAKRGRKMRKIRDAMISFVLIVAVFCTMCVLVYRLLFVVSDITAFGNEKYTQEEIIGASGVFKGDHLYSFRASVTERNIIHRCPQIVSVDIDRGAPNSVKLNVTEEECVYYADLYGEYRAVSSSLRVLYSISASEAAAGDLILLKLPPVKSAVAGEAIEFLSVRNDAYIYEVTEAIASSELANRVQIIDLRNKFELSFVCDNKYLMTLGDTAVINTKMRIASAVLKNEMFDSDDKARIDLSDTSKTSVVIDNQLNFGY